MKINQFYGRSCVTFISEHPVDIILIGCSIISCLRFICSVDLNFLFVMFSHTINLSILKHWNTCQSANSSELKYLGWTSVFKNAFVCCWQIIKTDTIIDLNLRLVSFHQIFFFIGCFIAFFRYLESCIIRYCLKEYISL